MITVDELRKLDGYPHYLGLGVIKCRIGNDRAYHFYCDRAEVLVDQIHDHRFSFTSTIIAGSLKNYIFEVAGSDPESTLQVERGKCEVGAHRSVVNHNAKMVEICSFTSTEGSSYYMPYNTLHRIERLTPVVITYIEKEPFSQFEPRFVVDTSEPRVCAMSQPKSQDECWEIIEDAINRCSA